MTEENHLHTLYNAIILLINITFGVLFDPDCKHIIKKIETN